MCLTGVLEIEPDDPNFVDGANSGDDNDDDQSHDDESEDDDEGDFDDASDAEDEKPKPPRVSVPGYVRSGAENRVPPKTDNWGRPKKQNRTLPKQENFDSFDDEEDITPAPRRTEDAWEGVSAAGRGRGRGAPARQPIVPVSYANVSNSRALNNSMYGGSSTPLAGSSVAPTTTTTTGRGSGRGGWAKPVKQTSAKYSSTEIRESSVWDKYARDLTNERDVGKQTNLSKKKKKKQTIDDGEDWD